MKMNLNFSLDVQEKSNNNDFLKSIKEVIENSKENIDLPATTACHKDNVLIFTDGSKCKFEGHCIVLID